MMTIVEVDIEKIQAFRALIITKTQGPQEAFALLCALMVEVYKMDHFNLPDIDVITNEVRASIASIIPAIGNA